MRPLRIPQGAATSIVVEVEGVASATEVEFGIDCRPEVVKRLSAGQISNVSATGFTVSLLPADFNNIKPGEYKCQARVTIAGTPYAVEFRPNKVRIVDSVFVEDLTEDYGRY